MRIETRYSLGDCVWHLHTFPAKRAAKCSLCEGTGSVGVVPDPTRRATCPECRGRRYSPTEVEREEIRGSIRLLTIGQVRVEMDRETRISYMAHETGVGSGTLLSESSLYSTRAAAREAGEVGAGVSVWVQPTAEHEVLT